MGLISGFLSFLFGDGRNVVRETAEVFRENTEKGAQRDLSLRQQALLQFSAEFNHAGKGVYDRFIDGLNRLPRPALALGTLGLFVAAMVDPLWFASRMQGIALVPEPLWWLLGVIVSFYFGARHQAKMQDFQREIGTSIERVPMVLQNLQSLQNLRAEFVGTADTGTDVVLAESVTKPDSNPALEDWRRERRA